ncbi:MAG: DUF2461 domain-containing protein [Saprospiraceae bacterium]|nr:DUF2461 domain-containing protein [Saprospiraceae bacterium]
MLTESSLQFLYDLSQNNNRDWFEKNKARYEKEVKKPFEQTVDALISRMRTFEPAFNVQAKDCIFRIYRDTRFSADKTPYKTNVSAVLTRGGRKTQHEPGYYLEVTFGACNLGGGAYFLEKPDLHKVRTAIAQDPETFRSIVGEQAFVDIFGDLQGEKNKVMPPEFKEAAKKEPYLYNKQFYFWKELPPETALGEGFVELAARYFEAARPVNEFLRGALG